MVYNICVITISYLSVLEKIFIIINAAKNVYPTLSKTDITPLISYT